MAKIGSVKAAYYEFETGAFHAITDEQAATLAKEAIMLSRSLLETGYRCKRKRFWNAYAYNTGITRKWEGFPLLTGGILHNKIHAMLDAHRAGDQKEYLSKAQAKHIANDTSEYEKQVEEKGYFTQKDKLPGELWEVYQDQKELSTALSYAWYLREYKPLVDRYKIAAAEQGLLIFVKYQGVLFGFQSRADAILQDWKTKEICAYSLKTSKDWTEKNRKSFRHDLQGITEIWALQKYLDSTGVRRAVTNVRLCVLRKGKEYYGSLSNGLIKPYRRFTGPTSEMEFAAEYRIPNPNNKSGYSLLGLAWEKVDLYKIGVAVTDWLDVLDTGVIQPELGDILSNYVFSPPEYSATQSEIDEQIEAIFAEELGYWVKIVTETKGKGITSPMALAPDIRPIKYRHSCNWPSDCFYLDCCLDSNVNADPLNNSDLFEQRKPHHDVEAMLAVEDDN